MSAMTGQAARPNLRTIFYYKILIIFTGVFTSNGQHRALQLVYYIVVKIFSFASILSVSIANENQSLNCSGFLTLVLLFSIYTTD